VSYPNVPLFDGGNLADWQRRVAQAINYLLNKLEYVVETVEGVPTSGQVALDTQFPTARTISQSDCSIFAASTPTADASFDITLAGSTIGTATILAGQTEGTFAFSSTAVSADARFQCTCPTPADATLADIFMTIALSE
jgi:hypothetical protein